MEKLAESLHPPAGYLPIASSELPFEGISLADFRILPKVDLHRHLVGAVRPEVLLRTARRLGVSLPIGSRVDEVRSKMVLREPGQMGYSTFLARRIWGQFRLILATELGCANLVYWAIADAHADGVIYVEFRISPYGIGPDQPITLNEFLSGLRRGVRAAKRDFPLTTGRFIFSLGRRALDRWETGLRGKYFAATVQAAVQNSDLIVGLDIAGDEDRYPNRLFVELAEMARAHGVPLTVHAGETGRPDSMWEAIELLRPQRIGHGIAAAKDTKLIERLVADQTPLEICPTSNYLLGVVDRYEEHPFKKLNDSGVNVTIHTDDPVLFDETSLSREYSSLLQSGLISVNQLPTLLIRSAESSFLRGDERRALIDRVRQFERIA